MKRIIYYRTVDGKIPIEKWRKTIKDIKTQQRIDDRLDRVASGNFGDHKSVSGGVQELGLQFGSGYRIYFAEDGDILVVLLCGGDNKTQKQDIDQAKDHWQDYLERKG